MKKRPLISVVTICYNRASSVEETIQSVLAQDYDRLDYVIIDGGSTDGTVDIINKYRDRLGYFVSEPDKGISDAFNKGVAATKGDLIVMINSDDIITPGTLSQVAEAYEEGQWDIYRCNMIIVNKETGFRGRDIPSMKFPLFPFLINTDHQGTYVTREAYARWGGYNTKMRYMMDLDFLMRCYRGGARMKYIPIDGAEFRLGGVSSDVLSPKRYDIEHLVLDNGGSRPLAKACYAYFWLMEVAKGIVIALFGIDKLKRLHYEKV